MSARFSRSAGRLLVATGVAAICCGATPAMAAPTGATVTGDAGSPVAITPGLAIRNMNTKVGLAFAATDKGYYAMTITGPDGVAASTRSCLSAQYFSPRSVDYRGNGAYGVSVVGYGMTDYGCTGAASAPTNYAFTVAASVGVAAPASRVLTRKPNSFTTLTVALPISLNPGALGTDVTYARGGVIGPDGAISGPSSAGYVDSTTGTVPLRLDKPGTYVVVARQKGFSTGTGTYYTPWSPAVRVVAVAPFDVTSIAFPDARGPSYRMRVAIREPSASGKVSIAMARGSKGGAYKSLGTVKISSKATFQKTFRQTRTGTYRIRLRYKGSSTVVGGTVVQKVRIARRLVG